MITASQLVVHAVGDYLLQSDWMAQKKTSSHVPALCHAAVYTLLFGVVFNPSWVALAVIGVTHFFIDRYRLARYVVWAKNWIAPKSGWPKSWKECSGTGYDPDRPAWLSVWLLIIADNLLHVIINGVALSCL